MFLISRILIRFPVFPCCHFPTDSLKRGWCLHEEYGKDCCCWSPTTPDFEQQRFMKRVHLVFICRELNQSCIQTTNCICSIIMSSTGNCQVNIMVYQHHKGSHGPYGHFGSSTLLHTCEEVPYPNKRVFHETTKNTLNMWIFKYAYLWVPCFVSDIVPRHANNNYVFDFLDFGLFPVFPYWILLTP